MKSKWQPLVLKEETHKDLLFSIASTRVLLFLHIALCVQEEIQGLQGKVRKLEEAMNMLGAEAETMKDEIQVQICNQPLSQCLGIHCINHHD
eukprot:scaffold70941_cov19-Tisochrysis_lutea.AAC.1